jgi:hypothetical protein
MRGRGRFASKGTLRVRERYPRASLARFAVSRERDRETGKSTRLLRNAVGGGGVPGTRRAGRAEAHRVDGDDAGAVQRAVQGQPHQAHQAPRPVAQRGRRARQLGLAGSRPRPHRRAERRGAARPRGTGRGGWGASARRRPGRRYGEGKRWRKTRGCGRRSLRRSMRTDADPLYFSEADRSSCHLPQGRQSVTPSQARAARSAASQPFLNRLGQVDRGTATLLRVSTPFAASRRGFQHWLQTGQLGAAR